LPGRYIFPQTAIPLAMLTNIWSASLLPVQVRRRASSIHRSKSPAFYLPLSRSIVRSQAQARRNIFKACSTLPAVPARCCSMCARRWGRMALVRFMGKSPISPPQRLQPEYLPLHQHRKSRGRDWPHCGPCWFGQPRRANC